MPDWKRWFTQVAGSADEVLDALRQKIRQRIGYDEPLMIIPYRGFGTTERLFIKGRVLADKPVVLTEAAESTWQHLMGMYRRFETDEVPGARLRFRFGDRQTQEAVTDEEGYFDVRLQLSEAPAREALWHTVQIELLAPLPSTLEPVRVDATVLVPPASARFGIISDIDDTVMWTSTSDKLKMFHMVFLESIRTRLPFQGVAAFYRALQAGPGGHDQNPIFYVSSSPWNLYDLLVDFFEIHDIPEGPLMLRDIGISRDFIYAENHETHKLSSIKRILDCYPNLPFILIGDTSQKDPEIYSKVVRTYPNRILAVYIRNVSPDPERQRSIGVLIKEVQEAGSHLVLASDSLFAATHAAEQGWIRSESISEVREEKEKDKQSPKVAESTEKPYES